MNKRLERLVKQFPKEDAEYGNTIPWLINYAKEQAEQTEELSVALNNANKEILVLKNQIRRLKNELSNKSTIRNK